MSAYPEAIQEFSGDTHDLVDHGDLRIFVAMAARTHEQVHWLQTVGSTFGRFLARNRIATGDLAEAILTTASANELGLLVDARRRGVAPAARSRQGQLRHAVPYSGTLQSLFDHWWATVALEHYLVDNGEALLGGIDPTFVAGLGLRYAAAGDDLKQVFNAPDGGFLESTRAMGPSGEPPSSGVLGGLSVRHVEEGAAMVAQHLFNARLKRVLPAKRYEAYAKQALAHTLVRFTDRRHSLYTDAIEHFGRVTLRVGDTRSLEIFLLCCDLALNPSIADDGGPLATDWQDFHPVLRFRRLVAALEDFAPSDEERDGAPPPHWWIEERARLACAAALSDGAGSAAFARDPVPKGNAALESSRFLRGFLAEAGANLEALRSRFPASVSSAIHAADPGESAFMALLDTQNGPGFDPPLLIKSGGRGEPASISDALYARATLAVTQRRAFHGWIAQPGPVRFDGLPSDAAGRQAQTLAINRLRTAFGLEI